MKNSTFEVFREIQSLHEILGEDAYLLDTYLVDVFERINSVDLMVTQYIAESVMGKLNILCYHIIGCKAEKNPQNEFCKKVKSFIENKNKWIFLSKIVFLISFIPYS